MVKEDANILQDILFPAVDELDDDRVEKDENAPLLSADSGLGSLTLVYYLIADC